MNWLLFYKRSVRTTRQLKPAAESRTNSHDSPFPAEKNSPPGHSTRSWHRWRYLHHRHPASYAFLRRRLHRLYPQRSRSSQSHRLPDTGHQFRSQSERYLKARYPELPPQAFVHYGNFIGETLKIASALSFEQVVMGIMIGKAVKLAEGFLDTHSKKVVMNKDFLK